MVAFADALLANLAPHLRERAVLEEAVREQRDFWLMLYRASAELGSAGSSQ